MPITPVSPIVVPQKTLDKFWIKVVRIDSPNVNGEASAYVQLVPYNDNGEFSIENVLELNIVDIMQKTQNPDSNIAKAMYFLIAAIDDEYQSSIGE